MLRLTAQLVAAEAGRGKGNALVTAALDFDDDYTRIYAERLAEGEKCVAEWLAGHAEAAIMKKCTVVYRLEQVATKEGA